MTSNSGGATVSILVNDGNGVFADVPPIAVGDQPRSVEAADFDGDGDRDLAVVAKDPGIGPSVRYLENLGTQGDPSFGPPISR